MNKRIKTLREQKKLSQREIARILNIYQQQYAMYEQGKTKIPTEIVIKICKLYNISADYILGLTDDTRTLTD